MAMGNHVAAAAWMCAILLFLAEFVEGVVLIFALPLCLLAKILSGGGGPAPQVARYHFVAEGRKLLARARAADSPALRDELALAAVAAADHAIAIDHFLPSPFAVRGLALHLLGERRAALSALDEVLAPFRAGYLHPRKERVDALVARAEIKLALYRLCTVFCFCYRGQAIADLREAVGISPNNGRANALLQKYD